MSESDPVALDLPEGWAVTTLVNLGRWQTGGTPSRRRPEFYGGGIPWVKSGDLNDGIVSETDETLSPIGLENSAAKLLSKGTLSIALYGATIGKLGILEMDAATNQACANCQIDKRLTHSLYLFYYLLHQRQRLIDAGQGGAQPNLTNQIVRDWPCPLPPLTEQKRIVAKVEELLAHVNAARERLAKVPALLKRSRQSLLASACSGQLTADWRESHAVEDAEDLLRRLRSIPPTEAEIRAQFPTKRWRLRDARSALLDRLPAIPPTWAWVCLPEIGYMNRGRSRNRPRNAPQLYGGKYPFIQTGDIAQSDGRIRQHKQTYSESGLAQSRIWPTGTICITIAANIADSAMLTYPACFPDSVVGLVPDEELCMAAYAEFFIRTARDDLSQFAPATAQKNINIGILGELAFPLPPLEEQHEIVRRVEALFALTDKIEARVQAATARVEKITQAILAKAFRGELVPTEAELARLEGRDYEPASVLIERIRASAASDHSKHASRRRRQPRAQKRTPGRNKRGTHPPQDGRIRGRES